MGNECEVKQGEKCPYDGRISALEGKVSVLEAGREKDEKFRKDYYDDRENGRIQEAVLQQRMKIIDQKLDQLIAWKDETQNKPNKLLDGLTEKAIWAVAAALIALLLAKLGVV